MQWFLDQIEQVNAQQSCRGRCKNSVTYNFTTSMPPTLSDACLCTLDCAEHSICCPDYAEYCVLGQYITLHDTYNFNAHYSPKHPSVSFLH